MSSTTQSTALRRLALAGAVLAAGVAAPAAVHAQAVTSERTLLNRIAIPAIAKSRSDAARTAPTDRGIPASIEGARALLGQTPARWHQELDQAPDSPGSTQVDGERALLGQWTRREARRISHGAKGVPS